MAYRQSYIGALKVVDPARFEREVRSALRKADGKMEVAAEILDVTPRTLFRWLAALRETKASA